MGPGAGILLNFGKQFWTGLQTLPSINFQFVVVGRYAGPRFASPGAGKHARKAPLIDGTQFLVKRSEP